MLKSFIPSPAYLAGPCLPSHAQQRRAEWQEKNPEAPFHQKEEGCNTVRRLGENL